MQLPLAATAFDRAAHHRSDPEWLAAAWPHARVVAVTSRSAAPAERQGGVPQLRLRSPGEVADEAVRRFLGVVDGVPYFAVTADRDEHDEWLTLRELGPHADDLAAGLVASAVALEQWHQRHPRCPLCGEPTVESRAGWTRTCPADGSEHFPRTDPAVIMLVHDGGDRVLLGRSHAWPSGRFSTLAGFVEPGESLEAAVAREVFEEVGVGVRDIRYVASQPWPFPASLMLGFTAMLDGDPAMTVDPVEMAEAGWFRREEVAAARDWTDEHEQPKGDTRLHAIPPRFSISRYLLDGWLSGY